MIKYINLSYIFAIGKVEFKNSFTELQKQSLILTFKKKVHKSAFCTTDLIWLNARPINTDQKVATKFYVCFSIDSIYFGHLCNFSKNMTFLRDLVKSKKITTNLTDPYFISTTFWTCFFSLFLSFNDEKCKIQVLQ